MMISELQNKDVVALEDGKKIGSIIDAAVDKDGNITSLIVQKKHFFLNIFARSDEVEIKWNEVNKIGTDVILVNIKNY